MGCSVKNSSIYKVKLTVELKEQLGKRNGSGRQNRRCYKEI